MSLSSLKAVWKHLGFTLHEVAQAAGLSPSRLRELDRDLTEITDDEARMLGARLGIDIDGLLDGGVAALPLAGLLKGQSSALDATARFTIAEAHTVAREIQALRRELGEPTGLGRVAEFHANADYGHPKDGLPARLANLVRTRLGLGGGPLRVHDQLLAPLGVTVLWAHLPAEIDALAFASEETGAVILANLSGRHMATAVGRRMTLAHEVCHLLFDRPEMSRFARACVVVDPDGEDAQYRSLRGQQSSWFEKVERRARAFAAALLAPDTDLASAWQAREQQPPAQRLAEVCEVFGLSTSAMRARLHNLGLLDLTVPIGPAVLATASPWELLEPAPPPAPAGVSLLRAHTLLSLADRAYAAGALSRRAAEELVRAPGSVERPWTPTSTADPLESRVSSMVPVSS